MNIFLSNKKKSSVYSVKVITRDAMLRRILNAEKKPHLNESAEAGTSKAQFTTKRQPVFWPAVAFSKTSFKQRSVQIKGNFTKLTLHLYFKCIMYYAGLLFCSVYCQ